MPGICRAGIMLGENAEKYHYLFYHVSVRRIFKISTISGIFESPLNVCAFSAWRVAHTTAAGSVVLHLRFRLRFGTLHRGLFDRCCGEREDRRRAGAPCLELVLEMG